MTMATIQNALHAWAVAKTGIAWIWADPDYPAPPYPYGVLNVIDGPRAVGWSDETRDTTEPGVVSDVTITPVVENAATYTVEIDDEVFTYISDSDATASEIVAGLVAAINHATTGSEIAAATDNGDGTLTLEHQTAGEIFTLTLTDNLEYQNNDTGHEVAHEVGGQRELTVSLQVLASDKLPTGDARFHLAKLFDATRLPSSRATFDAAGFALIERMPMQSLEDTANGERRSRAVFDVILRYATSAVERTGYMEKAAVSSDLGLNTDLNDQLMGVI